MNRRLTDKLELIRAPFAIALAIAIGFYAYRWYPPAPQRHVCPPDANCATVDTDGRTCWHRRGDSGWECEP